jgi:hypothetical protein
MRSMIGLVASYQPSAPTPRARHRRVSPAAALACSRHCQRRRCSWNGAVQRVGLPHAIAALRSGSIAQAMVRRGSIFRSTNFQNSTSDARVFSGRRAIAVPGRCALVVGLRSDGAKNCAALRRLPCGCRRGWGLCRAPAVCDQSIFRGTAATAGPNRAPQEGVVGISIARRQGPFPSWFASRAAC